MNALTVPNGVAVALFGIALSAAFCDIHWTKKNCIILAVGSAAMLLMQALITYKGGWMAMQEAYPLTTHLPLAIILSVLSGKWLWPTISVLAAYLCCQLRRWVALLVIAMVPGIDWLQPAVEMVVTLPLLAVLLRYVAPAARSFARYPRSMQLLFGVVPLAGYLFDYVTRIYTDLLAQGNQAAVEFMPFVCSVAYIVFVLRVSAEERTRSQLEQTRNNLKLQVGQAVREIEALRTSQQQTRAYRHDLRHHLQYISACIENGRGEQAQEYIQSICSEIEASKVTTYCENEAANLIFSSFAGRAENCGVPLNIQAHIPQLISVAETDLCVLLSNALENALRACRRMKAENGPAYIEVTAREKNGHLFLQFVNPCPEGIQFENGLPVTHAEGHGIGVRSICAIVENIKGFRISRCRTADSSSAFPCEPGRLSAVSGRIVSNCPPQGQKRVYWNQTKCALRISHKEEKFYETYHFSCTQRGTSGLAFDTGAGRAGHLCGCSPYGSCAGRGKLFVGASAGRHAGHEQHGLVVCRRLHRRRRDDSGRDGRVSGGIRRYAAVHL